MGLFRMAARTAVIAGTATHVANNVSRRQQRRWERKEEEQAGDAQPPGPQGYAEPPQGYAAPPQGYAAPQPQMPAGSPGSPGGLTGQLEQLAQLKAQGMLSDAEFQEAKSKLLVQ